MQITWWLFLGIHETERMRADCSYMSHTRTSRIGKALTITPSGADRTGADRSGADTTDARAPHLPWPFGASSAQPTL
jgi:hypothetical protein